VNSSSPVDRERRLAMPVALAAFGAVAAFILAVIVNQGSDVTGADTDAQFLTRFDEESGTLLLGTILQAAGMLLVIAPLFYLFQAAAARSDTVRPALVGITVAGPLFLAVGTILQWVAFDHAANEFATAGGGLGVPVGEYADNLIKDQGAYDASQGFTFAGTLGFVVAVAYTALHAMRTGLLTRFWGTLGMALGVSILFLGFVGVLVFILVLGILFAGWWPGGRPPAWEAGKAIPWARPGEEPEEEGAPQPAGESAEPAGAASRTTHQASRGAPRKRKRRRDG
jgi:hypothetical protein